jgi:hypothetical protein
MEPQFHQDQDGREGERGLKLELPIFQASCRQFIREKASPLDGVPALRHLCTQADGLVHRAVCPGVSRGGRTSTTNPMAAKEDLLVPDLRHLSTQTDGLVPPPSSG